MAVLLSTSMQKMIAEYLEELPQGLSFTEYYSEEARVIKISSQGGDTIAWLKGHHSAAKAIREAKNLREWGHLLNGPKVISIIEDRCLLLNHCRGHVVQHLNHSQAESLGYALAKLHTYPIIDNDHMPLTDALVLREERLLNSLDSVSQRLQAEDTHYLIYKNLLLN